jgi:Cu2+-exporting ATPase
MQRVLQVYLVAVLVLAAGGGALGFTPRVILCVPRLCSFRCWCLLSLCPRWALPTADEFAISRLRRAGLFIKHAGIWARLGRVRAVVFDKTGTLTMDTPELHNTQALAGLDGPSRVALFALVRDNLHPVARCLRAALLGDEASWRALRDGERRFGPLAEAVGQGVSIVDDQGHRWSLGRHDWLAGDAPAEQPKACCCGCGGKKKEARDNAMGPAGASFRVDGRLLAAFEFSDDVRDDAVETVRWLRERGLGVAILSGDAPERVQRVAEALGVPGEAARGACTPADKAAWIDANAPGAALMIGDGANDSLAFSRAICRGTPVVDRNVLESASDFFFFGRSLKCLSLLLETAARRRRTIRRIFTLAVVYNAVAVGLCLAGLMNPLLAAVLMPISSIASLGIAVLGR